MTHVHADDSNLKQELLRISHDIAISAAETVARRRREGVEVAATKSSPVDVVTAADRDSESFIRARLADLRPGDGFYGEESDATESETGITWVVDPIDGTVNYLYGSPNYSVSIAAVRGRVGTDPCEFETLAGTVASVQTHEVLTAVAGGGAFLNGEPLTASWVAGEDLGHALVGTGFSYSAARRVKQAELLVELIGRVRDVRRVGAASIDLAATAVGRLDLYYEFGLNPWDHAAGALVAREAGATVCGWTPDAREGRGLLVAGQPHLVGEFTALLREFAPDALRPRGADAADVTGV